MHDRWEAGERERTRREGEGKGGPEHADKKKKRIKSIDDGHGTGPGTGFNSGHSGRKGYPQREGKVRAGGSHFGVPAKHGYRLQGFQ